MNIPTRIIDPAPGSASAPALPVALSFTLSLSLSLLFSFALAAPAGASPVHLFANPFSHGSDAFPDPHAWSNPHAFGHEAFRHDTFRKWGDSRFWKTSDLKGWLAEYSNRLRPMRRGAPDPDSDFPGRDAGIFGVCGVGLEGHDGPDEPELEAIIPPIVPTHPPAPAVPEPGSFALMGMGILGLAVLMNRNSGRRAGDIL